jgi:hypothetical protein
MKQILDVRVLILFHPTKQQIILSVLVSGLAYWQHLFVVNWQQPSVYAANISFMMCAPSLVGGLLMSSPFINPV